MELVIYGLAMGALGVLWHRLGKPWCDRVSESARYPRLTRIGLVAFLYGAVSVVLIALAVGADVTQAYYYNRSWPFTYRLF